MSVILVISLILKLIIRLYTFVLFGRLVIDWVLLLKRDFRPKGPLLVLIEVIYTLTDPPIRMFRRILPPIRLGQVALDLGWPLTLVSCWIVIALLP